MANAVKAKDEKGNLIHSKTDILNLKKKLSRKVATGDKSGAKKSTKGPQLTKKIIKRKTKEG